MESDARSTTHPIQQPIATEADANGAFDEITYKKGQSFLRMLESFLGENVFRDGIRKYMARHKFSNTTTADLWNALGEASGKPVMEIAAAWTQQPGFPIVNVARDPSGKLTLTQERFTVNFPDAPALEWKIPLTYFVAGSSAPVSVLMSSKTLELADIPADRAVKLNVAGAGNYRVQYDEESWKLIVAEFPKMSVPDRVNLLGDAWALVQADRAPVSLFLDLVEKLPTQTELAEREQILTAFDYINRLIDDSRREQFQQYARSILRPGLDQIGFDPKKGEPVKNAILRTSLLQTLAALNDPDVIAGCRERFAGFLVKPASLPPDMRAPVLHVTGHVADEATWNKIHQLGLKTTSIEEKQNYYDALMAATDPKLVQRTLEISLTDELPTSRALYLVPKVARDSGHPELAWQFAKTNMKKLLAKADALAANSFPPSLFSFFSEPERIAELQAYAKSDLPEAATKAVAKAVDEMSFRVMFKQRLGEKASTWGKANPPRD